VNVAEIEVVDGVEVGRLPELMDLFKSAWWTASRTRVDVARMLSASTLVVALVHRPADRLVGFARVITDEVYLAVVLDVIVALERRGQGLGAMLLDAVVTHPRLAAVRSVELVCQPEMVAFYQRWGFTEHVGGSLLMRRTEDGALVSSQSAGLNSM
jgi:GNAT superfamily N-acetyltransferase